MAEHCPLTIRGRVIEFHIYITVPDSKARVRSLEPYFARMPDQHLDVLYPIFVMEHKPGGRDGGGTWRPGEVRSQVMGAAHSRNTLIPDADLELHVAARGRGMIGTTRDRWERAIARLPSTIFHEVGHCIDYSLGLIPHGAAEADFAGMNTAVCGAGNLLARRAVEAYARCIYHPSAIYHSLPPGETPAVANRRLLDTLRRSPAFHGVPPIWPPR